MSVQFVYISEEEDVVQGSNCKDPKDNNKPPSEPPERIDKEWRQNEELKVCGEKATSCWR